MEETKEKGICHQRPSTGDLISNLPDALISQILLDLPTKEAVRTSVLSNRWKSVWLLTPGLDLASNDFPDYTAFVSFMDKSLDFYRDENSCLHKLELVIRKDENDQSCVTRWIDSVATRKVRHIDVECILVKRDRLEVMPVRLFVCETLLYLRLKWVLFRGFESVSLPRLKTVRLEENVYPNEACLESLISSCPVLEDLSITRCVNDNVKVLRVHSQTITSLTVGFNSGESRMYFYYYAREILGLFIDAPRLKYLNFNEDVFKCQIISNLSSSVKVNLGGVPYMSYSSDKVGFSEQKMARKFFYGISRVRDLVISEHTMKLIGSYSRVGTLPQFRDLSCLEAKVCLLDVEILLALLESCPSLKSIILALTHPTIVDTDPKFVSYVPRRLLSSLEFVEIECCCCKPERVAMKLARHFAENSVILKKLVLLWRGYVPEDDSVLRGLLALSWRSTACQIEVCEPPKRLVASSSRFPDEYVDLGFRIPKPFSCNK